MQQILDLIESLTATDMKNKSVFELLASLSEELGELSRELKIENKTFGNTYKELDEGSLGESVDMVIASLAMYYACGGKSEELPELMKSKLDKWEAAQSLIPQLEFE